MANKRFPADMADISADATKVLGVKPDGTVGLVSRPPGGETLQSAAERGSTLNTSLTFGGAGLKSIGWGGNSSSGAAYPLIYGSETDGYLVFNSKAGSPLYFNFDNTHAGSPVDMFAGKHVFDKNGNAFFSGSVSGTVFNPTSLRSKKREIEDFEGDALSKINSLKLHTYLFREFEQDLVKPAEIDGDKIVKPAEYLIREVDPTSQQVNVGVIIDEIDDDLIADQERGVLNLNNIVFLQARAIQQLSQKLVELTERLEALGA